MSFFLRIIIVFFLLNTDTSVLAADVIDKVKKESKNIFKTLTGKSLKKDELIIFLSNYVFLINDKRGDGVVTYYFEDTFYKRYKKLELLSVDKWRISKLGHLKIFNDIDQYTWKIQPGKKNVINIKKKFGTVGQLYEFSYQNKTEFYLELEEKKLILINKVLD
tara:strand:+ start:1364 stop:1852 length:489 start_codon:yes stop_codon:yes gene_type:complete